MKNNTYVSVKSTVRLEGDECWRDTVQDNNGFDFEVNTVVWDGGDFVGLQGPGMSRDGKRLFVTRRDSFRAFNKLPEDVQALLIDSRREAILGLVREEVNADRLEWEDMR